MRRLESLLDRLIDALMWVACACGVLMMLHIAVDVFCRNVLNAPIPGTVETVSAYYMVAIAFFPLAYISRSEGHIFVELFTRGLTGRGQAWLDLVVSLVTGAYIVIFAWQSTEVALDKTGEGEVWETATGFMAVWPSRWFLTVGLAAMAIYTFLIGFREWRRTLGDGKGDGKGNGA